ncbi:hypothetical protein [Cellulomonas sp. URHE0023]|uniref:hypothetical protein n=1 Tax=Cellulomonas sp. URHE0023 TaxID=1380354 RepID=UPI0012DDD0C3|nr:hypothetical protein [Cellulomonas sp. URHE0023]
MHPSRGPSIPVHAWLWRGGVVVGVALFAAAAVTRVQSYIVYGRLMTMLGYGPLTPLDHALMLVGSLGLLAAAATRPRGQRRRESVRSIATEPFVLGAMCLLWYGLAILQWYLVLDVATTDGGASMRRDPTQIEPPLAVSGVLLLALGAYLRSWPRLRATLARRLNER